MDMPLIRDGQYFNMSMSISEPSMSISCSFLMSQYIALSIFKTKVSIYWEKIRFYNLFYINSNKLS
jgi:hypothetical protein